MLILAAFGSMFCDHLGLIFFPDDVWFRVVGRLAMPIFAGMVGRNLLFTRDADAYSLRLLLLAIVTQPIFFIAIGEGWSFLNVAVTLLAGVQLVKPFRGWWWCRYALLPLLCFSDYGFAGAAVVVATYWLARSNWRGFWEWCAAVVAVVCLNPPIVAPFALVGFAMLVWCSVGSWSAIDRAVSARLPRIASYGFYPLHLALLVAVLALT